MCPPDAEAPIQGRRLTSTMEQDMPEEIQLENATVKTLAHPATFQVPPPERLQRLAPGQNVQLCCQGERFWVRITEADPPKFKGMVNNDLFYTWKHGLDFGDVIEFTIDHIYKTYV